MTICRKVLHVITDLGTGGAEMMLMRLSTATTNLGHNMVVSLTPGGRLAAQLRDAGVEVVELDFRTPIGIFRGLGALSRTIRKFQPDAVQGWMYHGDLAALVGLALSGRRRQTSLVWGIRCSNLDFSRYRWQLRLVVRLCALLSSWPDAVIANSVAGMAAHRAIGYRCRREIVITNGVDLDRYRPDPAARRAVRGELGIAEDVVLVAHIARVDPMKDHGLFLEAISMLPDIQALLIGAGTEHLDVPNNVRRLGLQTEIPRLLAAADFIVSSSAFGEGFSNVLMEGMACGLPAIATDVGDARLILGTTGKTVPPRDAKALANAIFAFAQEGKIEHEARSRAARKQVSDNFSLENAVDRFNSVYDEILSARAQ